MRQDRNPKPRPPGFRNNLSFNNRDNANSRDSGPGMGMGMGRPQFNSGRPRPQGGGGRPPQRSPQPPRPRSAPKPMPIAQVPDRWKERRAMLKAAAWRFAKLVHKSPAVVVATEDPYTLIRVPDTRARQLAKKIIRLRRTRKPAPSPVAPKRVAKETREPQL